MTNRRIRIKFCGMTREQDVAEAAKLGVDAVGLIFYSKSPRAVTLEQAKKILQSRPLFLSTVAVLVNPNPSFVKELLENLAIDFLQFHGDESPQFCNQFNKPYIKAVAASSEQIISEAMVRYSKASAILLDTPTEHYGGSGKTFDWDRIPKKSKTTVILSGGLNVTNVAQALAQSNADAVDCCSGVEALYGIKDPIKMKEFIKAVENQ